MTPEYSERLWRAKKLLVQEMRDGCNECRKTRRGLCTKHWKEAAEMVLNPKDHKGLKDLIGKDGTQ